jgi:hypothetical protein
LVLKFQGFAEIKSQRTGRKGQRGQVAKGQVAKGKGAEGNEPERSLAMNAFRLPFVLGPIFPDRL